MPAKKPPPPIDRKTILLLAANAELDPRTVKRALEHGIGSLKASVDKERLRAAAAALGVAIPEDNPSR